MKKKSSKDPADEKPKMSTGDVVTRRSVSVIMGDILSANFFGRNKFTIILAVGLVMIYITYKYEFQTRMETIAVLEKQLAKSKSEGIRERSTYMSRIRESQMTQMVDSLHLDLRIQDQPPYHIEYLDR